MTAFLRSHEAASITGQTLHLDGGLTSYPDFRTSWSSKQGQMLVALLHLPTSCSPHIEAAVGSPEGSAKFGLASSPRPLGRRIT